MATNEMTVDEHALIAAAKEIRRNAHAPYSGFRVGAAVLDESGRLHTGCNVEIVAFPESTCAETNAIGSMVSAGGKRIVAIAAVGGKDDLVPCTPCGGCRQTIREFADENTRVFLIGEGDAISSYSIDELLPASFDF